jgi:signal peptidase I
MARHNGLSFYKRKKKISGAVIREIFSWIFGIILAVFLALVVSYFFGMSTTVVGVSMEDALYNGQTVLIDRLSYILFDPKAGDVVVFLPNGNVNSHYYIKRIVAVPGDKVRISDGILYVNDIESELIDEKIMDAGIAENEITLGSGEYFCIGDNVGNSEDSRSANIGPVNESDIIGSVWFKFKCESDKMGFVK